MLLANGCKVIGIDIDDRKCQIAQSWGIDTLNPTKGDDVVNGVLASTDQIGADGVIITASAKNNDIVSQAAQMSRKRGRIILVGVIGLNLSRAEFYEKELTFQVSCSYGPGRYDEGYEQKGIDYPVSFVRWTEKRNFEAILASISSGKLNVDELITERVDLSEYTKIYDDIGSSDSIASLLVYDKNPEAVSSSVDVFPNKFTSKSSLLGIIGAGNFTKMTMLPALKKANADVKYIASLGGVTGTALAKKYGNICQYHRLSRNI